MHSACVSEIQNKGFIKLPKLFSAEVIHKLKSLVDHHWENSKDVLAGLKDVAYLNQGHQMLYNVHNKNPFFLTVFLREPLLLNILMACLNDEWYKQIPQDKPNFILRGLIARSSGPGELPLHIDSFIPNPGQHIWMMQVVIALEKQTLENGCTLVVPGSHRFGSYAGQDWMKYTVPIESEPGDVVIWDSRLWHGASANKTQNTRWALIGTFSRWWVKQNYQYTETFPKEFLSQLDDSEKAVLGYCSLPPRDEFDRMDMKAGYEIFKKA
jgi:hypothetical protein